MKPEDFEQKLRSQSLRQIPAEWRAEILREGRCAAVREIWDANTASLPKWNWLAKIFWPNPKAWTGLAAIWVFIFVVNFSMRDKAPALAEKMSPPSPEMVEELKQQRLLFAELIGANDLQPGDHQKFLPLPQSERQIEIMAV